MSGETRELVDNMIKDLKKHKVLDKNCNEINTENIKEMHERHEKEIEELQERCKHPRHMISSWLQDYWAPGHMSDFQVKICRKCGKEVNRMMWCQECGKRMTSYMWKSIIGGMSYCKKCAKKVERRNEIEQRKYEKSKK